MFANASFKTFRKPKDNSMKNQLRLIALFAVMAALNSASAADVTGTITLKGTPPPEKAIGMDAKCGALHAKPVNTRFFVVDNGKLADVVVSLKGVNAKSTGASAAPLMVDQVGCEYVPYVAAAQTGQKIQVKNSDPFMHNVHPTPAVAGNPEANKAQMAKSPDLNFAFEKPEPFLRFKCDVHPWMFSYISIFDHPYFAVTGTDGTFKITNVPPGKYTVEVMHRRVAPIGSPVTKEIEVKDENVTADFELEVK